MAILNDNKLSFEFLFKVEIYVAEHIQRKREERRRRKEANGGRLPDDIISMVVFTDAYNFCGCSSYYGAGFAAVLAPTRAELATFYQGLKREYEDFVIRERLIQRLEERDAWLDEELAEEWGAAGHPYRVCQVQKTPLL